MDVHSVHLYMHHEIEKQSVPSVRPNSNQIKCCGENTRPANHLNWDSRFSLQQWGPLGMWKKKHSMCLRLVDFIYTASTSVSSLQFRPQNIDAKRLCLVCVHLLEKEETERQRWSSIRDSE